MSHVKAQQKDPVRGVWLTNVASEALFSRQNIKDAVQLCADSGINHIFVVTWNKGVPLYPSQVMQKEFGILIDERYKDRDPLQELLDEAHARNIKVHAWFEFGFASSYNIGGGHLLKQKPEWKAIDRKGNLVKKNNFEWMNAFDPQVQNFMISLITEVVRNYDIDGIQGDDRLPARPSTAGYDPYTVSLYQQTHNGQSPPQNHLDPVWIDWRAGLLNNFMEKLHREVKAIKPQVLVTMAPSVFPWSKEEYLQDWPTWVKNGWVDYVFPQIYRRTTDAYTRTLESNLALMPPDKKHLFYPGMILKIGDTTPSHQTLTEMVEANRRLGIDGEVFFFYEGLKLHPEFFKSYGRR
jgi:uncharacterized lipoprotein YddW (UPF0748 family)